MTKVWQMWIAWLCLLTVPAIAITADFREPTRTASPGLANATILIVRHAEKPADGVGLTPQGVVRSKAYVDYFRGFQLDGAPVHIDTLIAAADSPHSERSRLTLTPIGAALDLPIQQPFRDEEVASLAHWLAAGASNRTILIAWHHAEVPELLAHLGVPPTTLLTFGRWPPSVYDWVIVIRYDRNGDVIPAQTRLVRENISTKGSAEPA